MWAKSIIWTFEKSHVTDISNINRTFLAGKQPSVSVIIAAFSSCHIRRWEPSSGGRKLPILQDWKSWKKSFLYFFCNFSYSKKQWRTNWWLRLCSYLFVHLLKNSSTQFDPGFDHKAQKNCGKRKFFLHCTVFLLVIGRQANIWEPKPDWIIPYNHKTLWSTSTKDYGWHWWLWSAPKR